ncbi:tetraprenyl-beta-curcumene synthase family protein [Bacillaceae bacterium Marseille-Q3522]|nr:tetraprenyl-beta-curcumene synthase family protein [Bacillaceae bacterium Marseille-Q3522]
MSVPSMPISLMAKVYRKIIPAAHKELSYWRARAEQIADPELKKQALQSIKDKTFHCEGGSIMAFIANDNYKKAIKFIVAYQTISDYLDNLCDRSTSLDPRDFAALHESMMYALNLEQKPADFYRFRTETKDNRYLLDLAETCRMVLRNLQHYHLIKTKLLELCRYYCDLQIHKHVKQEERVPRLQNWFAEHKNNIPEMEWYEFSACTGSTLGVFCLVAYAFRDDFEKCHADNIRNGYFPYIQGLHILLDYLIDQEEDRKEGDLNFCFYYENEERMFQRLKHFVRKADYYTETLPHKRFHQLINRGLLGIYLSDDKVNKQHHLKKLARKIIKTGGLVSFFFYINGRVYRLWQKWSSVGRHRAAFNGGQK